jgi:hypothetical protein
VSFFRSLLLIIIIFFFSGDLSASLLFSLEYFFIRSGHRNLIMLSKSFAVLVAAATVSLAKTPTGFEPASNTDLIVEYSNLAALNGAVVSKECKSSTGLRYSG